VTDQEAGFHRVYGFSPVPAWKDRLGRVLPGTGEAARVKKFFSHAAVRERVPVHDSPPVPRRSCTGCVRSEEGEGGSAGYKRRL